MPRINSQDNPKVENIIEGDKKMKFPKLSANLFRITFLSAVVTGFTIGSFAQDFAAEGKNLPVGVWDVAVTIRNCSNGAPISTFPSLAKFEEGGTMTNQDVGNIRTPVPGIWSFTGGDSFKFAFKSFIYDAGGAYTGYLIVRHDLTINRGGDEYESEGTVTIYAPNGTQVNAGCSTAHGVRFQ